jgi:hypothetical protein
MEPFTVFRVLGSASRARSDAEKRGYVQVKSGFVGIVLYLPDWTPSDDSISRT